MNIEKKMLELATLIESLPRDLQNMTAEDIFESGKERVRVMKKSCEGAA